MHTHHALPLWEAIRPAELDAIASTRPSASLVDGTLLPTPVLMVNESPDEFLRHATSSDKSGQNNTCVIRRQCLPVDKSLGTDRFDHRWPPRKGGFPERGDSPGGPSSRLPYGAAARNRADSRGNPRLGARHLACAFGRAGGDASSESATSCIPRVPCPPLSLDASASRGGRDAVPCH